MDSHNIFKTIYTKWNRVQSWKQHARYWKQHLCYQVVTWIQKTMKEHHVIQQSFD
uniref:Uncharacterized protein n=1 Tax=Lotus japonicus TaxID=34305 RepID=I3SK52_LOTJA|nr:unknown [Lotus japonicus]